MFPVIKTSSQLNFDVRTVKPMPLQRKILMVRPTYFHLDSPINAHMLRSDGSKHVLDKNLAMLQWEHLRSCYQSLGIEVTLCDEGRDLPDMVFCANQCLPYVDSLGNRKFIPSNMANDVRHLEVPLVAHALQSQGYLSVTLAQRTAQTFFEGMGDALWLPGYRFLLGGFGHRTSPAMYDKIANLVEAPVATFELKNPRFYHLDTCLSILDSKTALACRDGFTEEGWQLLQKIFPNILEVSLYEADSPNFACNAHCPDGKNVILQASAKATAAQLERAGFTPILLKTDEFIKSGGSVFCMKLHYF